MATLVNPQFQSGSYYPAMQSGVSPYQMMPGQSPYQMMPGQSPHGMVPGYSPYGLSSYDVEASSPLPQPLGGCAAEGAAACKKAYETHQSVDLPAYVDCVAAMITGCMKGTSASRGRPIGMSGNPSSGWGSTPSTCWNDAYRNNPSSFGEFVSRRRSR